MAAIGMVWGLTEDSEHNIWVEAYKSLIRIRDLTVREEFPQPPVPLANKLAPDPQSGIWLGLLSGDLAAFGPARQRYLLFATTRIQKSRRFLRRRTGRY
jgi:hypothetical protein